MSSYMKFCFLAEILSYAHSTDFLQLVKSGKYFETVSGLQAGARLSEELNFFAAGSTLVLICC